MSRTDARQDEEDVFEPGRYVPSRLFAERVAAFWTAIWKCWRTVLDWTVLLYIALPGSFIAVGMYRDFMRDPPPGLHDWPLYPILALLALLQLRGKYRTFAESGDGLFLHRLTKWKSAFARRGFAYGAAVRLLATSATVALLSPALVQVFGLVAADLAAMVFYFSASGLTWLMARDLLAQRWRGWKRSAMLVLAGIAFFALTLALAVKGEANAVWTASFGAAFLVAASGLLFLRLRARGTLLHEIAVESDAYVSSVSLILLDTMDKKPIPRQRQPILFSISQPAIRHRNADADRLADSWTKSALRRTDFWRQLASFLGAGSAAIMLSPAVLAAFVWLVLPFLLLASLQRQWTQWLSEPYIALFHWREEVRNRASKKAKTRLALPIVAIWAVALGVKAGIAYGGYGWAAIAVVPVVGYFWTRTVEELIASMNFNRRKKERGAPAEE